MGEITTTPVSRREKHERRRAELIGEDAKNALAFQNKATRRFGPAAGVMLRQLLFWDTRGHDDDLWIYKSRREMERETGLNQRHQGAARKALKNAGVLEEKIVPIGTMKRPTLHYRLDHDALMESFDPVSATGHDKNGAETADLQEQYDENLVSGTGHGPNDGFPAYLSEETPETPVSGTGNGETDDFFRGLQGEHDENAVSGIHETTSYETTFGENKQCVGAAGAATHAQDFEPDAAGVEAGPDHVADSEGVARSGVRDEKTNDGDTTRRDLLARFDALVAGIDDAEPDDLWLDDPVAYGAEAPTGHAPSGVGGSTGPTESDEGFVGRLVAGLEAVVRDDHGDRLWPGQRRGYERQARAALAEHDRDLVEKAFKHVGERWGKRVNLSLDEAIADVLGGRNGRTSGNGGTAPVSGWRAPGKVWDDEVDDFVYVANLSPADMERLRAQGAFPKW